MNGLSLRKALIWIKRQTNTNPKNLYLTYGAVFLILAIGSLFIDYFLAFDGIFMILRALLLIPISASLFIIGYSISYRMHKNKVDSDPDWVSFRERFSPAWRQRIAIILGAVLIVIAYASQQRVGYTLIASTLIAIALGLIAFIRKTTKEKKRAELGIPDTRDIEYKKLVTEMEKEQAEIKKAEKIEKSRKKYRRWGIKDDDYVEEDEDIDEIEEIDESEE